MIRLAFILLLIVAAFFQMSIARAYQLPAGIAVSAGIEQVKSALDEVIRNAFQEANYAVAKAALEAKTLLDAWEQTNSRLLDKTFDQVDKQRLKTVDKAIEIIDRANDTAKTSLQKAADITEMSAQMVASLPTKGHDTWITSIAPRIIAPTTERVTVKVRGVNLDRGQLQVLLPDTTYAERRLVSSTLAEFKVPIKFLDFDQDKIKFVSLKTVWTIPGGFLRGRQQMTGAVELALLPLRLGYVSVKDGSFKEDKRFWDQYEVMLPEYRGKNRTINNIAQPKSGWRWEAANQSAFQVVQHHGESAHCHERPDWSASSENGIIVSARVDRRRSFSTPNGDGYVNCSLKGPIYQIRPTEEKFGRLPTELTWLKDTSVSVPRNSVFTIQVDTFDGHSYLLSSSGSAGLFIDVKVDRDAGQIIVRPKIPAEL